MNYARCYMYIYMMVLFDLFLFFFNRIFIFYIDAPPHFSKTSWKRNAFVLIRFDVVFFWFFFIEESLRVFLMFFLLPPIGGGSFSCFFLCDIVLAIWWSKCFFCCCFHPIFCEERLSAWSFVCFACVFCNVLIPIR